jgi:amino acid adenylation domain-containing protein
VPSLQSLTEYLEGSAARYPDRTAIFDPDGRTITYGALNAHAEAFATFLASRGVRPGDRVGVVLPKSVEAVTAFFGIMKAGAAYVPVDCTAPAERCRRILTDCRVRALVVDSRCLDITPEVEAGEFDLAVTIVVDRVQRGSLAIGLTTFDSVITFDGPAVQHAKRAADLAYILYTSGSTGMPKGVMLTHDNALSFVEWASDVLHPHEGDRFSSHAPFHFDLSILDIYLCIKHAAELHLVSEEVGKNPKDLADFITERRLTIWYSTPSILTWLMQFGNLDRRDSSTLRTVLFAGEVFPVKHLRALQRLWPHPVYYNLYGPTETNVCTFARIPSAIPDARERPYPIGDLCAHCQALVLDTDGREVVRGEEGLFYIAGRSVFPGYWNRPAENAAAFIDRDGARWYNTGDVVRWIEGEGFLYVGRNDRMVKRRGYRIELGEIERGLYLHERLREVAVVALDTEAGVEIVAFLSSHEADKPSIIELKTFCKARLPAYMSPDRFMFFDRLPRTSTDKVDYQALTRYVSAVRGEVPVKA